MSGEASVPNSAGVPRGGVAILPEGRADVRARRLHDRARLGHERREATSDASDSKGGDGGRVATCDGSVDRFDVRNGRSVVRADQYMLLV